MGATRQGISGRIVLSVREGIAISKALQQKDEKKQNEREEKKGNNINSLDETREQPEMISSINRQRVEVYRCGTGIH
jgi:ABC-type lipoprotein export system ATPase subunit